MNTSIKVYIPEHRENKKAKRGSYLVPLALESISFIGIVDLCSPRIDPASVQNISDHDLEMCQRCSRSGSMALSAFKISLDDVRWSDGALFPMIIDYVNNGSCFTATMESCVLDRLLELCQNLGVRNTREFQVALPIRMPICDYQTTSRRRLAFSSGIQ